MTCYAPLRAYKTTTGVVFTELQRHDYICQIDLPCGQCQGCRFQRASDWELRIMHEASQHEHKCFVTLTYGRDKLPPNSSLEHGDFQLFMRRIIKQNGPTRYYMCGEYGELHQRPHYHACLFGIDFRDRKVAGKSESGETFYESATLTKLWKHGNAAVQDLNNGTAAYCARYIMKKALGETAKTAYQTINADGEIIQRKPEYAAMSLKPGIGAAWFNKYRTDVYPHDYVISNGQKRRPPKYYDKLLKRSQPLTQEQVAFQRETEARKHFENNTPERLKVREIVHKAKIKSLQRNLK